jgi:hypothetical protein
MGKYPLANVVILAVLFSLAFAHAAAAGAVVEIATPMPPPQWAFLERALIDANTDACREFFERYFDERGFLLCVERWGGDDGPDDAIENCNDWPILHALGAPDAVYALYRKAWEGHLRQYTLAKTRDVPFARDGMYYKEFPVMFDWLHNGEGLTVFNLMGLSDPHDLRFQQRVRRYAGFYLNEDPGAPNYDPQHKLIRSLFNGSRGPLLRKATALDWAGDPIEVEHRFSLGHGERSYEEMLAHFKDYNDIIGDHPQNLLATSLALNAYMLTGEAKYKRWLLEYVDAWRERMAANGGIIPTNVGLDGKIGSATGGKWYGGVYGWGFSVVVPQTGELAHRNRHNLASTGFGNALLVTGDASYLEPWRKQIDLVNAQAKTIDGRIMYPHMYGDRGWYDYRPDKYNERAEDLWYWSMLPQDRRRMESIGGTEPPHAELQTEHRRRVPVVRWAEYLDGNNPDFPIAALQADLARVRERVAGMRADETTPDTRLADDPMKFNPCSVQSLIHLMLGGIHPRHEGAPLHCRFRYFDPLQRRPGMPPDVAALVESLSAEAATLTLVNLNQLAPALLIVQGGAYGEHQIISVRSGDATLPVEHASFTVRLAPGAGGRLRLQMRRYANQPTLLRPWDRDQPTPAQD